MYLCCIVFHLFTVVQCVLAVTSQVYIKKNLKLYKLEFFLCALMTHLQNIERNFTFTRKCTDNEERNEIGVSLSDSNEELGDKCLFDWNLINYWYNFQKHLHVFYQVRWSCWKIRHDDEYKLWLLFVKACRILTAPVITFRSFVLARYPVTSPPSRLATSELATKERSRHQRTRHQAKSSRHQPPIKRLVEESRMFGW